MIIAREVIELGSDLVIADIRSKPKQNSQNLKPARDFLKETIREIYRKMPEPYNNANPKGKILGGFDLFWQDLKKEMKRVFGYTLIRDIPYEQIGEVNDWLIRQIQNRCEKEAPDYEKKFCKILFRF